MFEATATEAAATAVGWCAPPFASFELPFFFDHIETFICYFTAYANMFISHFHCGFAMWVRTRGVFVAAAKLVNFVLSNVLTLQSFMNVYTLFDDIPCIHSYTAVRIEKKWEFQCDNTRECR